MTALRAFLARQRSAMAVLVALTMAVRLLVPAGYMPSIEQGRVALTLCTGTVPAPSAPAMVAHHGMGHGADAVPAHHEAPGEKELPCAFTDLALAALPSVDAPPLGPPELGPEPIAPPVALAAAASEPSRLRPPSRAPPRTA